MKHILYIMIFFSLFFASCAKESELKIYNDTGHVITVKVDHFAHRMLNDGEPVINTYYLNSYILFGETVEVPVEYVESFYRSHKKFIVTMKPNKDKVYHVIFDRAGLEIRNVLHGTIIDKVQLREVSSDEWSDDLYEGYLPPDEIDTIPVLPGTYYIRIEDVYELQYPEELIEFTVGETTMYVF
ncbi:MAG: hypothetical protein K8R49_08010 [Candidatus Cloacimonetes bacterium]|nr:hypothetical protein [Candidatus Cloacimonadota bacterium]